MSEHVRTQVDDVIDTVVRYNEVCITLQKVIYVRDAASVDCPVVSQVIPNVNDYDPSQNTLTIGYFPHRGSRTERFITVRRAELDKLFNSQH